MAQPYPPGARLLARPEVALPCAECGQLLGRGYSTCTACTDRVDAYWQADWEALLQRGGVAAGTPEERELAGAVVGARPGAYAWTCTDWALRLIECPSCRAELGAGDPGCLSCAGADQGRWAWDHAGVPKAMTHNEHLLRLAVAELRAAERRRAGRVAFWRLTLPFLLVGDTFTAAQARRVRTLLLAGRTEELDEADGYAAMVALPDLPWRD